MTNLKTTFTRGIIAGAVGTAAINLTTYLDMLARGRPPSQVPAKVAARLADDVGIEPIASTREDEASTNRRSAAGALMGHIVGIGTGIDYAVLRSIGPGLPLPIAASGIGLLAMAASDIPAAKTRATDPTEWSMPDWAADLIPHLVYGFATAAAYEFLTDNDAS